MKQLKENILACLQDLKGSGKFVSIRTGDFVFPGVEVKGLGEIAFPVNKLQAKALIEVAHKAPFGKSSQTIIDENVRSGWEIDADNLQFNNPNWKKFLGKAVKNVQKDLGLEDYTVHAEPYKLLIYEKGDFFLPHRDSEKAKGMFGTLIIGLPSQFTGGELHIRFENKEEIADFSDANTRHSLQYTAFYADCEHEVKPLASGYRVCLVYNLIQRDHAAQIDSPSIQHQVNRLVDIFKNDQSQRKDQPYIILLGHQYTPENFSENTLKLNDRVRANALLQAARELGYYSNLCLVTSYIEGAPEYDGYYGSKMDEVMEMGEIFEEDMSIKKWLVNETPALNRIHFSEEDLITSFPLNEGEPIARENTGYMGNYGPDIMYWYHYGAVVLWSPETNTKLLPLQNTETQLKWIEYYTKTDKISTKEIDVVKIIVTDELNDRYAKKGNFNAVVDWLINQDDRTFFVKIPRERLQFFFDKIDADYWVKTFRFLPITTTEKIFVKLTEETTKPVLEKLVTLLKTMDQEKDLQPVTDEQIRLLPQRFTGYYAKTSKGINRRSLSDLLVLSETQMVTEEWAKTIVGSITKNLNRDYVHHILAKELLATKTNSDLKDRLRISCQNYLDQRVADKPQPPANWSRPVPDTKTDRKQWDILSDFLESPDEHVFDYSIRKDERVQMENAIRNVTIDLKTETIRKGSPHTLRITKTQAAYNRARKKWLQDVELLKRLKAK